jgi:hypothetical protein
VSSDFSLFPKEFAKGDLGAGEDSIESYAEKKYFQHPKH